MPRKDQKGSTPRAKLKADLTELTGLRKLWKDAGGPSPAYRAVIRKRMMRKHQLTEADLRLRHERWVAMGSPELHSAVWQAELDKLRRPRRGKQERVNPPNTDPADSNSLYWALMRLSARQAAKLPPGKSEVDAIKAAGLQLTTDGFVELPGQNHYRQTKQKRAEAARLYRWLWRNFPNLLRACDKELRDLMDSANGIE